MSRPRFSRAVLAAGVLALSALSATPASAQTVVRPPKISEPSKGQTWLYYLIGFGLGAAALGLTIMPSRRTHQD